MVEPHQAEAVVRGLYAAFARRDVEAAVALVDPDVEFWPEGTGEGAGRDVPYRGHDGIRRYFLDVAAVWDELEVRPSDLRAIGDAVIVFGTARGVTGGRAVDVPAIWVWKLRDGLLFSGRAAATAADAMRVARA